MNTNTHPFNIIITTSESSVQSGVCFSHIFDACMAAHTCSEKSQFKYGIVGVARKQVTPIYQVPKP